MVKLFSDNSNNPERALQVWQILIAKAESRQTITYGDLGKLIGYRGATNLSHILGHIKDYCDQNKLPPLTALVVNKQTGIPGKGLDTLKDGDSDRESVFKYDWYGIVPPTPDEFREAKQT